MQTLKITQKLRELGHGVHLLCAPGSQLEAEAANLHISTWPFLVKDLHILSAIGNVKRLVEREKFDLIHSHLSHDLWTLAPATAFCRHRPALLLSKRMASSVVKKDPLHRYIYSRVDRILTVSDFIRENVLQTCPVRPEQVFTLRNGLELEKYQPEAGLPAEIRPELGIDPGAAVVGVVGRLTPKKGHKEFLYAAKEISKAAPGQLCFLIVGGASHGEEAYGQEIRKLVAELGLQEQVRFTGHRRDIPRVMAAIDILVFPSYAESFGNILLEAMAMQLPVIAFNSGAVPEIVVDGQTGLLTPPLEVEPIVEKVLELLDAPHRRRRLGQAGRRRVETHFRFDVFMDNLEKHYHEQCL